MLPLLYSVFILAAYWNFSNDSPKFLCFDHKFFLIYLWPITLYWQKHGNVPKFGNGDIVNVPSTAQIKGREKADEAKASDTYSSNHILSCMEKGSHEISGKDAQHDLEQRSKKFRSYLRWVFVVQSNIYKSVLSWSVFFTLTFIVPVMSQYLLHCPTTCDANHRRPYHIPVQISLTVFATLSFICLSRWDRKYGLSKFLFLDKVSNENLKIQRGYAEQMQVCIFINFLFCFLSLFISFLCVGEVL